MKLVKEEKSKPVAVTLEMDRPLITAKTASKT
jgi:hypothetical protein